jgi:hypothetical protein
MTSKEVALAIPAAMGTRRSARTGYFPYERRVTVEPVNTGLPIRWPLRA